MTAVVNNGLLVCYNKGCGQQFNPDDNKNGELLIIIFDKSI